MAELNYLSVALNDFKNSYDGDSSFNSVKTKKEELSTDLSTISNLVGDAISSFSSAGTDLYVGDLVRSLSLVKDGIDRVKTHVDGDLDSLLKHCSSVRTDFVQKILDLYQQGKSWKTEWYEDVWDYTIGALVTQIRSGNRKQIDNANNQITYYNREGEAQLNAISTAINGVQFGVAGFISGGTLGSSISYDDNYSFSKEEWEQQNPIEPVYNLSILQEVGCAVVGAAEGLVKVVENVFDAGATIVGNVVGLFTGGSTNQFFEDLVKTDISASIFTPIGATIAGSDDAYLNSGGRQIGNWVGHTAGSIVAYGYGGPLLMGAISMGCSSEAALQNGDDLFHAGLKGLGSGALTVVTCNVLAGIGSWASANAATATGLKGIAARTVNGVFNLLGKIPGVKRLYNFGVGLRSGPGLVGKIGTGLWNTNTRLVNGVTNLVGKTAIGRRLHIGGAGAEAPTDAPGDTPTDTGDPARGTGDTPGDTPRSTGDTPTGDTPGDTTRSPSRTASRTPTRSGDVFNDQTTGHSNMDDYYSRRFGTSSSTGGTSTTTITGEVAGNPMNPHTYGINEEAFSELVADGYTPGTPEFAEQASVRFTSYDAGNITSRISARLDPATYGINEEAFGELVAEGYDPGSKEFIEATTRFAGANPAGAEAKLNTTVRTAGTTIGGESSTAVKPTTTTVAANPNDPATYRINEEAFSELVADGYEPGTKDFINEAAARYPGADPAGTQAKLNTEVTPSSSTIGSENSTAVQPTDGKPIETTGKNPVSTTNGKPVETTGKNPVSTTNGKPVETTGKNPVSPTDGKPVETTGKNPVSPTDGKPVETTGKNPVSPTDGKPVETTGKNPVSPTDGTPNNGGKPVNVEKVGTQKTDNVVKKSGTNVGSAYSAPNQYYDVVDYNGDSRIGKELYSHIGNRTVHSVQYNPATRQVKITYNGGNGVKTQSFTANNPSAFWQSWHV